MLAVVAATAANPAAAAAAAACQEQLPARRPAAPSCPGWCSRRSRQAMWRLPWWQHATWRRPAGGTTLWAGGRLQLRRRASRTAPAAGLVQPWRGTQRGSGSWACGTTRCAWLGLALPGLAASYRERRTRPPRASSRHTQTQTQPFTLHALSLFVFLQGMMGMTRDGEEALLWLSRAAKQLADALDPAPPAAPLAPAADAATAADGAASSSAAGSGAVEAGIEASESRLAPAQGQQQRSPLPLLMSHLGCRDILAQVSLAAT